MRPQPIVAIDGPAGVGKSTAAKGVAKALGFALIDTGALYRTVALLADRSGVRWEDGDALAQLIKNHRFAFDSKGMLYVDDESVEPEIRSARISAGASKVARHQAVRDALLEIQRDLGRGGGVVLEGRDIGTVVFPDAEAKFFLTASSKVRARRRFLELCQRGETVTIEEVEWDQDRRDEQDRNREIAPLRQAEDAVPIYCDDLTAEQVITTITQYIHELKR